MERDKEEDGFAHQDGKRPRKETLFGGARVTIETGSDFPIGVRRPGFARSPPITLPAPAKDRHDHSQAQQRRQDDQVELPGLARGSQCDVPRLRSPAGAISARQLVASAGRYRCGGGCNETIGAFETTGRFGGSASRQAATQGDAAFDAKWPGMVIPRCAARSAEGWEVLVQAGIRDAPEVGADGSAMPWRLTPFRDRTTGGIEPERRHSRLRDIVSSAQPDIVSRPPGMETRGPSKVPVTRYVGPRVSGSVIFRDN